MTNIGSFQDNYGSVSNQQTLQPVEAYSISPEGRDRLASELKARGFELRSYCEEKMTPEGIVSVCAAFAINFYRMNGLMAALTDDFVRTNCSQGVLYEFDPLGEAAKAIRFVYGELARNGFLAEGSWVHPEGRVVIRQHNHPRVRKIITGSWLEINAYQMYLANVRISSPEEEWAVYRNVKIYDIANGIENEIDLVLINNNHDMMITECRSSDFAMVLGKYEDTCKRLGLPMQNLMVIAPRATRAQIETALYLFDVNVANLWGGLKSKIEDFLNAAVPIEDAEDRELTGKEMSNIVSEQAVA